MCTVANRRRCRRRGGAPVLSRFVLKRTETREGSILKSRVVKRVGGAAGTCKLPVRNSKETSARKTPRGTERGRSLKVIAGPREPFTYRRGPGLPPYAATRLSHVQTNALCGRLTRRTYAHDAPHSHAKGKRRRLVVVRTTRRRPRPWPPLAGNQHKGRRLPIPATQPTPRSAATLHQTFPPTLVCGGESRPGRLRKSCARSRGKSAHDDATRTTAFVNALVGFQRLTGWPSSPRATLLPACAAVVDAHRAL